MKVAHIAGIALVLSPIAPESPSFSVEKDDALSSAWSLTTEREVLSAEMSLMGDPQDVGTGSTTTSEVRLEFLDTFTKVSGERAPLAITRSYESLSTGKSRAGGESGDEGEIVFLAEDGESQLAGASVDFTYDAEDDAWSAAFAEDSEGEDEWLNSLAPRVDLAGVLPIEEIEVGDSWELDSAILEDILRPGGDVIIMEDPEMDNLPEGGIAITLPSSGSIERWDEYEGDIEATFEEIVEDDGRRLAKIVVKVDVESDLDIIEALEEQADERGSNEAYSDGTLTRSLEGAITIHWNLKTHRPHSLEGELQGSSEMKVDWTMGNGGFDLELGFAEEAEITHKVEATFGD